MRDTSHTGEVSRTQGVAALTLLGKHLLAPLGDFRRSDLAIDEGDRFLRVQCKTGRLINGAIVFYPCSVDSRSEKGRCIRRGYRGEVELFGVYCPDNGKCYLVPVEEAPTCSCCLRITPPQNGQKTKIRWAHEFEIGARVPEPIWLPEMGRGSVPERPSTTPSNSP